MITLNIDDIQHNLSEFIKLIQEGNIAVPCQVRYTLKLKSLMIKQVSVPHHDNNRYSLIITQADQPIAEIKPILTKPPQKERRPIGLCEGEFVVPDDFNDPLPEEIINLFTNS